MSGVSKNQVKIFLRGGLKINIKVFFNRLGYHELVNRRDGQVSYVRRLGRLDYPRFHVYLTQSNAEFVVNLHLDEKKPSYEGFNAHSGEYDGELVAKEAERIRLGFDNLAV